MSARILSLFSRQTFRTPLSSTVQITPGSPSPHSGRLVPFVLTASLQHKCVPKPCSSDRTSSNARDQDRAHCTWRTLQVPPTLNDHFHMPSILLRLSVPTSSSRTQTEVPSVIAHGERITNHSPGRHFPLSRTSCSMYTVIFHSSMSIRAL